MNTLRKQQRDNVEADKAQKKSERLAKMLEELNTPEINEKEKAMRDALQSLDRVETDGVVSSAEASALRQQLNELQTLTQEQERNLTDLQHENEVLVRKRDELEARLTTLELEYEELLGMRVFCVWH